MSVLFTGVNFSHLNSPDMKTGVTPLQVAIKTGNLRTVQALLNAKASLEHLDNEANSVFHYAASTTKEIISVNICHIKYYFICMEKEYDGCVCVCVCARARVCFLFLFFFINSMPHYKVILHALGLNNYSMVTYNIYNLRTISSVVYSYSNFKSDSLM
jgi:hypothetical protein